MMTTPDSAVSGNLFTNSQPDVWSTSARVERRAIPGVAVNPLERLAQIMRDNDRLMEELTASRERVVRARAYLDEPTSNVRFGEAHLDRCRTRHVGVLARLRANRIETLELLGHPESPAA